MPAPHDSDVPDDPADAGPGEVDRLRAEVARLETEIGGLAADPTGVRRGGWWRSPLIVVLLLMTALIAPLAVVATWAHDEIGDTDRYVDTVAPLADNRAVQAALITRITDEIMSRLDVRTVTDDAISALTKRGVRPSVAISLKALSTPLVEGIDGFITRQVTKLVESEAFAQAWREANRQAHSQMVAVLTGKGGPAVQVDDHSVQLDLAVLIDTVKNALVDQGFALAGRIPEVNAEFTIFQGVNLTKAQSGFRLLSALATALPIVALLLFAAAVSVSRRRRHTLVVASLVVAASMLLLGLALNGFRSVYLGAVPTDQLPTDAAGAIYDQLVWFIRLNLRALLVLFLAVAAVAWVSGPGRAPSGIRAGTSRLLDKVRHRSDAAGLDTGPVGRVLGEYRGPLRAAIAGVVLLVYVLADHPTGAWTLTLLLVAAVALLVIEVLARPPADDGHAAEQGD